MRTKHLWCLLIALIGFGLVGFVPGNAQAEKTFKLTYSTYFNPKYTFIVGPMENFAKKVEQRTNGRVKIDIYHSAQLYKAKEEIAACERGVIDMTSPLDTYTTGIIPAMGIGGLPFLFKDAAAMQRSLHAGLWDFGVTKALDEHNLVLLGVAAAGGYQIYSKEEVVSPEQFKGKIWGVSGSTASKICQDLGGSPTTMSSGELYLALQRGTIDGCTRPLITGAGRKLDEVAKHLTLTDMYFCNCFLVINKDVWNSMPKDIQEIMKQCAAERDEEELAGLLEFEKGVVDKYKASGVAVHKLSDAQFDAFAKAVAPVYDWWLGEVENGQKYIEFAKTHQ
ncbi:MAG: TRAP transporter substrate-binding protein [Desulfovibrionaceae bacterium]|jgi:C4-dicarboxylate-binding protein DctP|nr:TRAP transporter substrate-binding protein [Desulfovibrionaceae bacterium]